VKQIMPEVPAFLDDLSVCYEVIRNSEANNPSVVEVLRHYAASILVYLLLRCERQTVAGSGLSNPRDHPVVEHIARLKKLVNEFDEEMLNGGDKFGSFLLGGGNEDLNGENDSLQEESNEFASLSESERALLKKALEFQRRQTKAGKAQVDAKKAAKDAALAAKRPQPLPVAPLVPTKRPANKDIIKNRGLTPYRKKATKAPRTRLRKRTHRALVKTQGQVSKAHAEHQSSGFVGQGTIRTNVVHSRKMA